MKFTGATNEKLIISEITPSNQNLVTNFELNDLTLLWFNGDSNHLVIDSIPYELNTNQIICLTEF